MDVQNQRWVTIHVACSSIAARRGGNVRKIEFPCRQSRLRRRGANTAHTAPARAPTCTTPLSPRDPRKHSKVQISNTANRRKSFRPVLKWSIFFNPVCRVVYLHGGLIKGLWVWRRPSRTWVSLSLDHINSCSFLSSLKVTSLHGRLCTRYKFAPCKLKNYRQLHCLMFHVDFNSKYLAVTTFTFID